MGTPVTAAVEKWIRETVASQPERVKLRTRHIEKDRIWREIDEADVRKVLERGAVSTIRSSDQTIIWRGKDGDGRELELLCSMVTEDGKDTLVVKDAYEFRVGAAYDPTKDDELVKRQWLANHPEYEELPDGRVQKRITVTKV